MRKLAVAWIVLIGWIAPVLPAPAAPPAGEAADAHGAGRVSMHYECASAAAASGQAALPALETMKLEGSKVVEGRGRVSRLRAVGASMLLPGLGQIAMGHRDLGRIFLMAEATIFVGFVASEIQGYVRKNRYIDYAETFAGVSDAGGRPDRFYRNLATYPSFEDYRDVVARDARAIYGDDLAAREAYVEMILEGTPTWEWASQAQRLDFRTQRQASRNAFRRASLFLGGALLNRLVSAVDAAWLAGRRERGGDERALYYQPVEGGGYVCLRWALSD